MFKELDVVVLTRDLREQGLPKGLKGAIVHCYEDGQTFEVEFVSKSGEIKALLTVQIMDIELERDAIVTAKKLEDSFKEEVRSREHLRKKKHIERIWKALGVAVIMSAVVRIAFAIEDIRLKPLPLPKTGTIKLASEPNYSAGQLRIFLREPLAEENSTIASKGCGNGNSNNYFVQLLDWESGKVVTTAFIRSGDMLEMSVPLGSYKLRYTEGTEWYGEKEMFRSKDSKVMSEVTQNFSHDSLKFEFTEEKSTADFGFKCLNGNLGKKEVTKDN